MIFLTVPVQEPVRIFKDGKMILTIKREASSLMSFDCDRDIRIVRDKVLTRESEDAAATTSVDAMEPTEDLY